MYLKIICNRKNKGRYGKFFNFLPFSCLEERKVERTSSRHTGWIFNWSSNGFTKKYLIAFIKVNNFSWFPHGQSCWPEIILLVPVNSRFAQIFCSSIWALLPNWSFCKIILCVFSINSAFYHCIPNDFNFGFKPFWKTNNIINCFKKNKNGKCMPSAKKKQEYVQQSLFQSKLCSNKRQWWRAHVPNRRTIIGWNKK